MLVEIIIFLLTTFVVYYLYIYKKIHYFYEKRGIRYVPGVPVFGNMFKSMSLRAHMWEDFDAVYRAFPDEKYVGFIDGTTPAVMIRDPEIIKSVTIKDFDHFVNHKEFFPEDDQSLLANSLIMMKDDRWRDMRTTLSPAFTGSKMRLMVSFMEEISDNIIKYLKDKQSEDINVDDLMRRYTNDVIASAGFGLQVNSLVDKDNEFYNCGQNIFNFTLSQRIGLMIHTLFPSLAKKLRLDMFDSNTIFFKNIVARTMEYRLKNNVERPDMIQLLMEASKGTLNHSADDKKNKNLGFAMAEETNKSKVVGRKWNDVELAAQVFVFFVAGFETTSGALILCIHELALNPDVQERLYEELQDYKSSKGKFQYESIHELKYLDCVLTETSRKWAAAVVMDRICTKAYQLPPVRDGALPYKLKPGDLLYNAVNSIHMDPKYYPDPERFDPDRFSEENKHKIKPGTYMPFGNGPRVCLGARFATLEIKVLLYNLVLKYKILKCDKTSNPIKLLPRDFNMKALGGTWVRFEARE